MPHFAMMGLVSWIMMGLFAGAIARYLLPAPRLGCLLTIGVGIAGAIVGGFVATLLGFGGFEGFDVYSLILATIGAILLLLLLRVLRGAPRTN